MIGLILKLGYIEKIPYFRKPSKRPFIKPFANVISFFLEISIVSFFYLMIENPLNEVFGKGFYHFLEKFFAEGIYFVMTTATTVGYGDLSPNTLLGKLFVMTVIFIYISLRFVNMLGGIFEARQEARDLRKIGRLFETMKDHVIIYGDAETIKRDNFLYLKRFISELKNSNKFKDKEILFVNHNEDASKLLNEAVLSNMEFKNDNGFHHMNLNIDEDDFFEKISIDNAEHIFILGNPDDTHSDAKVLTFAIQVEEETSYSKDVTAEVVNEKNRKRTREKGGVDVIMRPNRAYPGMLVRATITKGYAEVIEELSSVGNDTIESFKVPYGSKYNSEFLYGNLMYKLSMSSIGTLVAIVYKDGRVDPNLMGVEKVSEADDILIMINEMRDKSYSEIQEQINKIFEESLA